MRARLYLTVSDQRVTWVSVDIKDENGEEVFHVSTSMLKSRELADKFLTEQVQHYVWLNKGVKMDEEYDTLISYTEFSTAPLAGIL